MKAGITGLPFSGKTTLFCALTGQEYDSLSQGRENHVGMVAVPDERLDRLYDMFQPKKKTNAVMEYYDIAGTPPGSGEGLDAKTLQTLRNTDSIITVVDAFNDGADPAADFDTLMEEFGLTDLIIISNRLERIERELRAGKSDVLELEKSVLERCQDVIENGGGVRDIEIGPQEEKLIRGYQFLTAKPLLIVLNVSEDALADGIETAEHEFAEQKQAPCAAVCAEVEMEIAALDDEDERRGFLESMNIREPALGRLIRMSYGSLGLMSFFTAGGTDEVRAWTVRKGSTAKTCAGAIHSDLERGFIRAETIAYDDLMSAGSFKEAREQGTLRTEGKEYIVQDGDVLTIRFSV